ncbi:uncharacterized protein V1510DRAFT_431378 [Dipodascopsis tothii]|uniref:uncharacterized protein n=1 Tax=Dipodascopsis tothii TaxID=44089 RepID=UPI0034CF024A
MKIPWPSFWYGAAEPAAESVAQPATAADASDAASSASTAIADAGPAGSDTAASSGGSSASSDAESAERQRRASRTRAGARPPLLSADSAGSVRWKTRRPSALGSAGSDSDYGSMQTTVRPSVRIYRLTAEYVEPCNDLLAEVFADDPLAQYLQGPRPPSDADKRFFRRIKCYLMERYPLLGHVPIRAAMAHDGRPGADCTGFALYKYSDPLKAPSLLRLFWFDFRNAYVWLYKLWGDLWMDVRGVVSDKRHKKLARAQHRVLRRLLPGRRFLILSDLGVAPGFRNEGVATQLMRYGTDMADTQRLPIYLQASSARIIKFYEKFGFRLVHELRLVDGGDSCSVYCMIREPVVRRLTPLPPLGPDADV